MIGFSEYQRDAQSNLNSPIPIAVGQADSAMEKLFRDWHYPPKVSSLKMMAFAWSSLRSACMLSRMGMVGHVAPIQRQALEAIGYSFLFNSEPDFHNIWMARDEDPVAKNRFRREGWSKTKDCLRKSNKGLLEQVEIIYDDLIDFGAHPNPALLHSVSTFRRTGEEWQAEFSQLQGQPFVDHAHYYTARLLFCALEVSQMIWPVRFSEADVQLHADKIPKLIIELGEKVSRELRTTQE